ncbi:MAG: hypothetical protein CSB47_00875 [Proteobacteria bacterium]|nr:MAG: hypothetical protein CSB47_00875 [Pseudomonadota bacterium]
MGGKENYNAIMKKLILSAWLLLVHAIALLAVVDTDLMYRIDRKLDVGLLKPPEITQYHHNLLESHLSMDGSVEAGSVIFLGDSLTQGLNVAAIAQPAINYGIGMDTTAGLLRRIPQYQSLSKASAIIICIGINDLIRTSRSDTEIIGNYRKILDGLPDGVPAIIQAIFPVDERLGMSGFNQRIQTLNASLAQLATHRQLTFADLQQEFTDASGNLKPQLHSGDGLHLNTAGYQLWIQALKRVIHQGYQPLSRQRTQRSDTGSGRLMRKLATIKNMTVIPVKSHRLSNWKNRKHQLHISINTAITLALRGIACCCSQSVSSFPKCGCA